MFGRLNNRINTRPYQQGSPLVSYSSQRNCIYKHNLILSDSGPASLQHTTACCTIKVTSSSETFSLDRQYNKEWTGCIATRAGQSRRPLVELDTLDFQGA